MAPSLSSFFAPSGQAKKNWLKTANSEIIGKYIIRSAPAYIIRSAPAHIDCVSTSCYHCISTLAEKNKIFIDTTVHNIGTCTYSLFTNWYKKKQKHLQCAVSPTSKTSSPAPTTQTTDGSCQIYFILTKCYVAIAQTWYWLLVIIISTELENSQTYSSIAWCFRHQDIKKRGEITQVWVFEFWVLTPFWQSSEFWTPIYFLSNIIEIIFGSVQHQNLVQC